MYGNVLRMPRIRLVKMENIQDAEITAEEAELPKDVLKGGKLRVSLWEEDPGNIPDSEDLKLVVLKKEDMAIMRETVDTKGRSPRVNKNTIFFL